MKITDGNQRLQSSVIAVFVLLTGTVALFMNKINGTQWIAIIFGVVIPYLLYKYEMNKNGFNKPKKK